MQTPVTQRQDTSDGHELGCYFRELLSLFSTTTKRSRGIVHIRSPHISRGSLNALAGLVSFLSISLPTRITHYTNILYIGDKLDATPSNYIASIYLHALLHPYRIAVCLA